MILSPVLDAFLEEIDRLLKHEVRREWDRDERYYSEEEVADEASTRAARMARKLVKLLEDE
jgi:hypothetical protein